MGRPATLAPCGTNAAYRRHMRAGEIPCQACRQAAARYQADRMGYESGTETIDTREIRNNLPEFVPYVWRGRK